MKKKNLSHNIFILLFIAVILVWFITALFQAYRAEGYQILFEESEFFPCNDNWYYEQNDSINISKIKYSVEDLNKEHVYQYKIPENAVKGDNYALCFYSRGVDFTAYMSSTDSSKYYEENEFDDTVFYNYKQNSAGLAGNDIGLVAQIVPLYWTDTGNEITLKVIPTETSAFIIDMRIQETSDFIYSAIRSRMGMLVGSFLIAFWGIAVILYTAFAEATKREEKTGKYALGAFCFILGLLLIIETQVIQILTGKPEIYSAIKYVLLLLLSAPFAVKVDATAKAPHRHFSIVVGIIVMVLILAEAIGSFLFDISIYRMFYISAIMLLVDFIMSIYYMIKDIIYCRKNPDTPSSVGEFMTIIILGIIAYIDISIYFFNDKHMTDWGRLIRYSFLVFILVLVIRMLRMSITRYNKALLAEQYRIEARTDVMTGLYNKAAFLEKEVSLTDELYHFQKNAGKNRYFGIITFDLNNLKHVNDTFGHAAGDKLIINSASQIKAAVGRDGDVYRVGGDEFTAIIYGEDPEKLYQSIIDTLIQLVERYNQNNGEEFKLSIAYGHSICTSGEPAAINRAEREADQEMYECKRRMKK